MRCSHLTRSFMDNENSVSHVDHYPPPCGRPVSLDLDPLLQLITSMVNSCPLSHCCRDCASCPRRMLVSCGRVATCFILHSAPWIRRGIRGNDMAVHISAVGCLLRDATLKQSRLSYCPRAFHVTISLGTTNSLRSQAL